MVKVVIVDDSPTARLGLRQALESDPGILVVGEAANGNEAMSLIRKHDPDLVTMDVFLEEENGLDVAARIMAELPRPIIVVTGVNPSNPRLIYNALNRGVLEVFAKLPGHATSGYPEQKKAFIRLVKTLSGVPVLTRGRRYSPERVADETKKFISPRISALSLARKKPEILLIGASTGGPPVVAELLRALPKTFPSPIVVVQHISNGFGAGLADWLGQVSRFPCVSVTKAMSMAPNTVYVAPDNRHLKFSSKTFVFPVVPAVEDVICPSIDTLFFSAERHFGSCAVGILLTGMGQDGARGLKKLYDAGSFTIVQAPETCVVDSMPQTAIHLKGVHQILSPDAMPNHVQARMG